MAVIAPEKKKNNKTARKKSTHQNSEMQLWLERTRNGMELMVMQATTVQVTIKELINAAIRVQYE